MDPRWAAALGSAGRQGVVSPAGTAPAVLHSRAGGSCLEGGAVLELKLVWDSLSGILTNLQLRMILTIVQ